MKRLLTLFCALVLVTSVSAQRVAVLEFTAGSGVSQADIDGVASIFNTYFTPNGYTLVERIQIERVISEQNLQKDKITQAQMVRIGEILNVSVIVTGKINIHAGEYNIDVQALNVESGVLCGKAGITWKPDSSYRNAMKQLALDLADQIAIKPIEPVIEKKNNIRKRTEVEVVLGYLKVYPTELGVFPSAPNTVIAQINRQHLYDYDTWRIPTIEELALLRANDYLSDETYISSSTAKSSGIVLLVTDDLETYTQKQARLAQEVPSKADEQRVATTSHKDNFEVNTPTSEPKKSVKTARFTIMNDVDFAFGDGLVIGSPTLMVGSTLKDRVFIGIGSSLIIDYDNDIAIPIYANSRVYFTKNTAVRPYFSLSIGGEVYNGGFYINPSIGIDIPISNKLGIYTSVGYEGATNWCYYCDWYDHEYDSHPVFLNYVNIKLGIRFQ